MNDKEVEKQGGYAQPPGGYAQAPGAPGAPGGYTQPPGYPPPGQYYRPYVKPVRTPYSFDACDAAYACFALALGFLCWEFRLFSDFGGFLVIIIALVGTALYLNAKGVRQSPRSIAVFTVCVLGALPLLLYDSVPISALLTLITLFACFYWIAVSTGNSVESRISGFILADWANQTFCVPFSNYAGLFVSIKTASKDTKRGRTVLIGIIGLCIAIPLIIGVTALLINSDAGFEKFADDFSKWLGMDDIGRYILHFIVGIPIALYIFGAVCGNVQKRYTTGVTREETEKSLAAAHRIPRAAILPPLAVFCILYIVYIVVMSIYLFTALSGKLPDEWFVYSEYARRGFFELCGVAAINLFIVAFTYSFAARKAGEYPKSMRILTSLLCVMTELLVATAISKMLLYVDAYGLSRLRVYTLWFLILLFVVFAVLIVWHIKPFNAGRPIVVFSVGLLIALLLANTDGLIAKYNVWQYQNERIRPVAVDTDMLGGMSDAVLPYLVELRDNAPHFYISLSARDEITRIQTRHDMGAGMISSPEDTFRDWSIQSALMKKYLPEKHEPAEDEDCIEINGTRYSTSLTELHLASMYLSNEHIVSLQYMTNLTHLSLRYNNISDLTPLSGLTSLTSLDLRDNYDIVDLAPLAGLENLTCLSINTYNLADLSPLSSLTSLTNLDLGYNQICDISHLSTLVNLKVLDLRRNHITDLTPLSTLTNLTWLSLSGNEIHDLAPLSGLVNLKDLSLSNNQIDDITPLASLRNLIWLDVDRNDITDLAPLSDLTKLTYTNIEENAIDDWTGAKNIRNVQGR